MPSPVSGLNSKVPIFENVIAVITHADGSKTVRHGKNIVTDAGDIYYAQKACGETPTNTFANLYLGSAAAPSPAKGDDFSDHTAIASTSKAKASGYPKSDDDDANNLDAAPDVISWKFAYAANEFTASSVTELVVAKAGASGTDPVLSHAAFATAFAVTAADVLNVFLNHTVTGA